MPPTDRQLKKLYELIQLNWRDSGLLYDFAPDPDSVYPGCYLAIFGTPIDNSNYDLAKVYYIYPDGHFLDEDDFLGDSQ
ncbi:MAG: hypothetical protein VKK07_10440 [Merismopediaceae bacterium]|nr:hypothetical protein [Merismopediaceae bacterium]